MVWFSRKTVQPGAGYPAVVQDLKQSGFIYALTAGGVAEEYAPLEKCKFFVPQDFIFTAGMQHDDIGQGQCIGKVQNPDGFLYSIRSLRMS